MILEVIEHREVAAYILSRQLFSQYKKAKEHLLAGNLEIIRFKSRQPKSKGYYQFRINHKYRAYGYFETKERFIIFEISDHQDSS